MKRLCLLLLCPLALADDWGRLFHDAETRRKIDAGRDTPAVTAPPQAHRYTGELRHGGRVIRFVDGAAVDDSTVPPGARVGEHWQEPAP